MEELKAERNKYAATTSKDNIVENDSDEDEDEQKNSNKNKLDVSDEEEGDNDNDNDDEEDELIGPSLDFQDDNLDESVNIYLKFNFCKFTSL
jgi:hypothetical protein